MTKTSVLLHCAAAVIVAFGICGGPELRAQSAAGPLANIVRIGQVDTIPDTGFDAGAGLYQGIVQVGANPPSDGPPPTWPCVGGGGDAPCSSVPAGGFVVPYPFEPIPTKSNGEIVWTFTTTSASGTADFAVKITQGTTTIFTYSGTGTVAANGIYYAYVINAKLSGAKKGVAKLTVTTTVGAATITGRGTIHIE
jgi:hypothetical protein